MEKHESGVRLGGGGGLDIGRLERELTAMWADATAGGEGAGVMRACVLNLIVYAPVGEGRASVDALLDRVYESSPCRALVIFADRDAAADGLDAYVSTRCSLSSKGARQICGEQITIEAAGGAVSRAASAVAPLLVPDVPVFLCWKDIPHYEDKLFTRLVEISDRVVIDSASFDNPQEDLARLARVVREHPEYMAVSDLNWGRLTPWRALVAGFWDVADYRPHLSRVERLTVEYAPRAGGGGQLDAEALLLAGWLSSRLGWQVESSAAGIEEGEVRFEMRAGEGRRVVVGMRAAGEGSGGGGGVSSLALLSGEGAAEFHVGAGTGGAKLEAWARVGPGGRAVKRVVGFEGRSEGEWLSGELAILTRDKVYEQAVEACARMLESLAAVKSS